MKIRLAVLALACSWSTVALTGHVSADAGGDSVIATFDGQSIRLSDGWGEAGACHSDDDGTRCYRTEREMNEVEGLDQSQSELLLAACSTSLRLYRGTSFGGGVLSLTQRFTGIALGPYGFDNDTSSYKVGACSSTFYDGGVGSAAYPGATGAGAQSSSMVAGWNNRISTVYIS